MSVDVSSVLIKTCCRVAFNKENSFLITRDNLSRKFVTDKFIPRLYELS